VTKNAVGPKAKNALGSLVTSYFRDHLQRIRGASPHTVRAYALTIRLYLSFLADTKRRSVSTICLGDLDVRGVADFLADLERTRGNIVSSRNSRLAALHGFFEYLLRHDPINAEHYHQVLALPSKRATLRPAVYLEPELVRSILEQPDQRTSRGVRDCALLLFLYNTGARIAEALSTRWEDIETAKPPTVRLRGKGRRERICPLWPETVAALRRLVETRPPSSGGPLFRNDRGGCLTRDGAAYILDKYVARATTAMPALRKIRVTPHVLRHSCAVALLQAGVDVTVIRDYLGHASIATTNRYLSTNLEMRRRVLERFWKRSGLSRATSKSPRPSADIIQFLDSLRSAVPVSEGSVRSVRPLQKDLETSPI
jgi:integrase/recombinase XerD